MSKPSRYTLRLLADDLARNWTQRTIEDLFEDAGVGKGPESVFAQAPGGVRRGVMAQYMATLNLDRPSDRAALYRVFNTVLESLADRCPDTADAPEKLERGLRRDGIAVDSATHQIAAAGVRLPEHALCALPDASAIREHLTRMDANIETDPRLAVSVAKDLVESTAKLTLRDRSVPYTPDEVLPALVTRAQEALGLSAAKVPSD